MPTRWPTDQPSTAWPGSLDHWIGKIPSTVAESEWQTPQASTRMRTWPAGGSTSGLCDSSSLPGPTACTTRYVDVDLTIFALHGGSEGRIAFQRSNDLRQ